MNNMPILSSDLPDFRTVLVTPKDAEDLLRRNTRNRTIRRSHVADMARDMKNGQWAVNGEAIKIAKNGDILDGQHRLLAVVLSGSEVYLTIVSNLDPESQFTMDLGFKRGNGDHLRLRGETDAFALAALVRTTWQWEQNRNSLNYHIKPTQREIDAFLLEHPELRRSVEIANRCYRGFRFFTKTAYGTAHYVLMKETDNNGRIPEFFARVEDGTNLDTGNPILTMRRRAMSDRDNRVRLLMGDQVGYLLYTYDSWVEFLDTGKKLHKFMYQKTQSSRINSVAQNTLPIED